MRSRERLKSDRCDLIKKYTSSRVEKNQLSGRSVLELDADIDRLLELDSRRKQIEPVLWTFVLSIVSLCVFAVAIVVALFLGMVSAV